MTVDVHRSELWNLSQAQVGGAAPAFEIDCADLSAGRRRGVRLSDYAGEWLLLLFCPHETIFGCASELMSLSAAIEDLHRRGCAVLAIGRAAAATFAQHFGPAPMAGKPASLRVPIGSDPDGSVARAYGVYDEDAGSFRRGTFIIDPHGVLQYQVTHDVCVGRTTDELLRVVDALRAGGLCALRKTGHSEDDHPVSLGPEKLLGHYRVESKLGEGGFGQVFRAWDLWLHRTVALKLLRPGSRAGRERVLAEARSAACLSHPNVCTIYSVEEHNGQPLIAMEYLSGRSLARHIRRHGALSAHETSTIARQVAWGLVAAHGRSVVHGDLKPGNIMLTAHGIVKVLDFGLAAREPSTPAKSAPPSSRGKTSIRFRGTPPYMNPEQALGAPLTPASDVFTLGLVLYEMLTGKRANSARSPRSAARAVRSTDLTALAEELPHPLGALMARCVSLDPAARPTMSEVADYLDSP